MAGNSRELIKKGDTMKKLSALLVTTLLALSFGGYAFAELKVKTSVTSADTKPFVKKERFVTKMATVEAVDLDKRILTLKSEQGKIFDLRVGPRAKNLDQLKKGDMVIAKYYEATSEKVYKPGEAPKVAEGVAALETAKKGAKPGARAAVQATVTATIESIDKKKPSVTLKTVEG